MTEVWTEIRGLRVYTSPNKLIMSEGEELVLSGRIVRSSRNPDVLRMHQLREKRIWERIKKSNSPGVPAPDPNHDPDPAPDLGHLVSQGSQ